MTHEEKIKKGSTILKDWLLTVKDPSAHLLRRCAAAAVFTFMYGWDAFSFGARAAIFFIRWIWQPAVGASAIYLTAYLLSQSFS